MLDGRRYYATGPTEATARRRLGDIKRDHARGQLVVPQRLRVAEHLNEWLEVGAADWKPRTTAYYRDNVRLYLEPAFGHMRLQRLEAPVVARQFARWRADGRASGGTLLNVYKTFHRALVVAHRWGRIARNPLDAVEPPRARRRRPTLWSVDETREFLAAGGSEGPWPVAWSLLIGTGARLGEVLALEWSDVDLGSGRVHIARSAGRLAGTEVVTAPKTEAGERTLNLPQETVATMRRWRAEQAGARLAAGSVWASGDRVLSRVDGRMATRDAIRWAFQRTAQAAGVPRLRLHDLRHLHATFLLAQGLPPSAVAARLGHATPAVTMAVYARALSGSDDLAAQSMSTLLA
ncbi:MAG: tyrosine-type recombinase/integrase [Dehalococcoidia bacterium]